MQSFNVAILGVTGAVGTRMLQQLEKSDIAVDRLVLLASARSAGQTRIFRGQSYTIEEATTDSFKGIDIVLSSAGGSVSKALLPAAVKAGAVCVDNTSAFRMEPDVPLVVPEVNPEMLSQHHGIVANPNCSTIQMVVALAPIDRQYKLHQVLVSTYQAASGAGQRAMNELFDEAQQRHEGEEETAAILPVKGAEHHYPLAFNLLPQIDVFEDDGFTHEEWKMIHETKKILRGDMNDTELKVSATCVRVPVPIGHGESVYFETHQTPVVSDMQDLLAHSKGVVLQDDPAHQVYPQPINAAGHGETFVGRMRADRENPGAYHMWVVADNLLKGAALNAVQIAQELIKRDLVRVPEVTK